MPKPQSKLQSKRCTVYLTPKEFYEVTLLAASKNLYISDYIRKVLGLEDLSKENKKQRKKYGEWPRTKRDVDPYEFRAEKARPNEA